MLRINLERSPLLVAVLILAHAAAAVTLWPLAAPAPVIALLALSITASLAHTLRRHAWLVSSASITAMELAEGDRAAIQTRAGHRLDARILGTTYVSPLFCVINLRVMGEMFARHAVIVPDNIDAETFRSLRVRLRWGYRAKDRELSP